MTCSRRGSSDGSGRPERGARIPIRIFQECLELAGAGEGVQDVAHAGASGKWREEGLNLVFGGEDGLTEIERDKGRQRGRLTGVSASLYLLGETRRDGLPEGRLVTGLGNGNDTQLLPELREGAENGSLSDFLA